MHILLRSIEFFHYLFAIKVFFHSHAFLSLHDLRIAEYAYLI